MAEEILMTVTEKERQIAMELSQWKYEFTVNAEKAIAREEGHAEGHAEGLAEGKAEGKAEGLAEGLEKGRAEGREEGIALGETRGEARGRNEGLKQGAYQNKLETARKLKILAMPIPQIAEITGLAIEEIEKL